MRQLLIYSLLFITACSNDNTATETGSNNSTTETNTQPTGNPTQGDGIIGEWQLLGSVMDTNDNLLVDDAERNDLKKASYEDYMQLNSDGTGLFTVAKMEGRYEAKVKDGNDKKFLTWYDKGNGEHRIGTIISVSKDELHIKEPGGHGLIIWKRS